MGIMVASGSLAKFSGPLVGESGSERDGYALRSIKLYVNQLSGNAAYLATDRRTWLPMLILGLLQVAVIVLFLLVYRSIKPRKVSWSSWFWALWIRCLCASFFVEPFTGSGGQSQWNNRRHGGIADV